MAAAISLELTKVGTNYIPNGILFPVQCIYGLWSKAVHCEGRRGAIWDENLLSLLWGNPFPVLTLGM